MKLVNSQAPSGVRWPLRLVVPLALLIFVAAATFWGLFFSRIQVAKRIEQEAIRDVTWTMSRLVWVLERAARNHDQALIPEAISGFEANRDFVFAALFDESGRVLYSMHEGDVGKSLPEVLPAAFRGEPSSALSLQGMVSSSSDGRVVPSGDGLSVVASYPVVLEGDGSTTAAMVRRGTLVAIDDYSRRKAHALDTVTRLVFSFFGLLAAFAMGLGAFFHFAVARRLQRLGDVARQVGAGDMHVRSGLSGGDEVSELARSFDQMLADKATSEQKRSDSEEQLRAIWDATNDPIITIDEIGVIQTANRATERLFGYGIDALVGNNVQMLMPSPYKEEHDRYLANYRTTKTPSIIGIGREVEAVDQDGTRFPIDLSVSEVHLGKRQLFVGIIRDIRERKKAEEMESSLGRILEESLNEVFIFDAGTLRFLQVNRGARENIGYSMEELQAMTPVDIKPEHTTASFAQLIEPVISGAEEIVVFQSVHRRKDGSDYDVEVHVQRTTYQTRPALVAFILDISERKQREQAMELLSTRLRLAIAVGEIGLWDWTITDGQVYFSEQWKAQLGYAADELEGNFKTLESRIHPDDRARVMRAVVKATGDAGAIYEAEFRLRHKSGAYRWILAKGVVLRDAGGDPYRMVALHLDFTDRRRVQEQLASLNAELESRVRERTSQLEAAQSALVRQEKLAILGQLAGSVAHEIRNPLGVIRNAVYYLQQVQSADDEDEAEALAEISRGLMNSERIISELLDYARAPRAEVSDFPVDQAIKRAIQMVKLPAGVDIVPPTQDPGRGRGDQGQIERLLANLIQNAAQAMPDGGLITIKGGAEDEGMVIQVIDSGVGIAADEQEKIFEPLYTKRAKGIGLGLAICRRYAELNGGSLGVMSNLGEGATFQLTLPIAD